jgi:lipoprotein-releasing system permease protein
MYLIIRTIVTAYYKKSHHRKKIGWMIWVSFLTTFLSTITLSIALAIINGFQESTEIKMKGIHSDLTLDGYGFALNTTSLEKTIAQEFPQIETISFYAIEQCLVGNSEKKMIPQTALFFGIEPTSYCKTHALQPVIQSDQPLDSMFGNKKIVIGSSMAESLELTQGSLVDCIVGSFDAQNTRNIEFNKEQLIVSGIFKTGIEEFDNGVVFSSFETLQAINPESQITKAACRIDKKVDPLKLKQKLEDRLSLHVMRWQDYYPALVSAMSLENKICTLIFILIVFMASLTNAALLLLYINNKKKDIALMQLLGVKTRLIQTIFITFGLCLNFFATTFGILSAALFSCVATEYRLFALPEAYYIDHIIFSFLPTTALFVLCISLCVTMVTSYLATQIVNKSSILDNLQAN